MIDILLENLDRLWRGETALKNQIVLARLASRPGSGPMTDRDHLWPWVPEMAQPAPAPEPYGIHTFCIPAATL